MKRTYMTIAGCLLMGLLNLQAQTICVKRMCDQAPLTVVDLTVGPDTLQFAPPFVFDDAVLIEQNGCIQVPSQITPIPHMAISPSNYRSALNSVTQEDLDLLSKHIHGIQPFTAPWQWIAADVNRDNLVNLQDSIELRAALQGQVQFLPHNYSWRYVRADYVFPTTNPLSVPYPESIGAQELFNITTVTFLGVKIGDLNCATLTPVEETLAAQAVQPILFPNPTDAGTTVSFHLEEPVQGQIQVRDISGKLLFTVNQMFSAGRQTIEISAKVLAAPGVYFWSMELGEYQESGKLIRM